MASSTSTFATLKALHLVITDALDDIQRVFSQNILPDPPTSPPSPCSTPVYPSSPDPSSAPSPFPTTPPASFPPTPLSAAFPSPPHADTGVPFVDYPSPDLPFISNSLNEQLALHPDATAAASRIVAACGQMSNIVHKPFLSLCDAIMSYNLPACMRLVEHLHIAEILREAEDNRQYCLASGQEATAPLSHLKVDLNLGASEPAPATLTPDPVEFRTPAARMDSWPGSRARKVTGLHVTDITNVICSYAGDNYIDPSDLVHVLRLLSTHHIFRETAPDTFALTRVASLLDSGKSVQAVFSSPETKYDDTGGTPALVALSTDELFKSAAYLTEAFTGVQLPPLAASTPNPSSPAGAVLSGTTKLPSSPSRIMNDPASCTPTARSSSVLTHVVYPEDKDAQPSSRSLLLAEQSDKDSLHSFPTGVPIPLVVEPSVAPPCPGLVDASSQIGKDCLHSRDTARREKLLAFNLAFRTHEPLFEWLENGGEDPLGGTGQAATARIPTGTRNGTHDDVQLPMLDTNAPSRVPRKSHRLQRFSKAMMATTGWEAPKAILNGFDWHSLPKGSTIVDVGGGIGSTTMILARALNDTRVDSFKMRDGAHDREPQSVASRQGSKLPSDPSLVASYEPQNNTVTKDDGNVRFVVQDKPVVTALGIEAWRSKWPEILESGQVAFQDQDFFEPQPHLELPHLSRYPAIYLLRVVLHDWPDELARCILINLRVASNPATRLVIAEHVLPLACADEDVPEHVDTEARAGRGAEEWTLDSVLANVEGAERTLVPPPLLSNLGKASANAYWMDLVMQISLNGKERTLREFCALALSAGWRVSRMTRPEGSLFAYLVCEPIALSDDAQAIHNAIVLSSELSTVVAIPPDEPLLHSRVNSSRYKRLSARPPSLLPSPILERSSSRCATPTFGSRVLLPKDEELQSPRPRVAEAAKKWLKSKGLGVRGVMTQKAEKQREEQILAKCGSARENSDAPASASPSHMRVWWKKSPPSSTSNSSVAVHELNGDVLEHHAAGRWARGTLKSSDRLCTPSPRSSPGHPNWPSTESATPPTPDVGTSTSRTRRPSVPSITRKLSFATFGRRPSMADITKSLPPPPAGSSMPSELAPPPILHGDTERSLKHLPSSPALGRSEVGTTQMTAGQQAGQPAIPRRPSLSFASQLPHSQPVLRSAPPRRSDMVESPKSNIPKARTSSFASKQSSPDLRCSAEPTSIRRRSRRMTLSNSPGASSSTQAQSTGSASAGPDPAGPEVKRMPSMPRLPRRLSIPMLRRKQSQTVVRSDAEKEG